MAEHRDDEPLVPRWSERTIDELCAYAAERVAESTVSQIPFVLNDLLERLVIRLGIDRSTVCALAPDRQGFVVVAVWAAPGVPLPHVIESHAPESTLVRRALRGEVLRFEQLETASLPSAADRRLLDRNGVRSLLGLPLRAAGGLVGLHLLGGVRRRFRWPQRFIKQIGRLGPLLALALERMQVHQRLAQERREHEDTQRLAGIGHWRYSFATGTSLGSPELYRMLCLDPRAELEPLVMLGRVMPEDRAVIEEHVRTLLSGRPSAPCEVRLVRPDGSERWIQAWAELSTRSDGSTERVHGVIHDITESKRAELAIEATSGRLVRAQEEERARLGRELHDELGQRVAALAISLGSLEERARAEAPALSRALGDAREHLGELGVIVRSLSHSLHPQELRRLGLGGALTSLCRRVSMLTEVDVQLEVGALPEALPEPVALSLYRVTQESLSNAVRHGRAREISVRVQIQGADLRLLVCDDGQGFDPSEPSEVGLGVLGMQERMRLVLGTLQLHSTPSAGTVVEARVPLAVVAEPPPGEAP
ncbi:MAG: PAS domain-containing protein [Myxococcales bacterium]|nr:PAS domain-containing protein [Myxococcales bacterium]